MNSDADYSYTEPEAAYAPSSPSILWPFALLTCAVAIVMIAQTMGVMNQKTALRAGIVKLVEADKALADNLLKREPMVKQSAELKKKLNDMVMDILILGKTDDDAKAIIAKYNIQQGQPASGGDAPAGDSAAPK